MKRSHALVAVVATAFSVVVAAGAYTASAMSPGMTRADVTIHHSWWGCHTLTLNGTGAGVSQHVYLPAGYALTVRNRDTCEHRLLQTAGPKDVQVVSAKDGVPSDGNVPTMGTPVLVRMFTPGTYEFTTVEGVHTDELSTRLPGFFQQPSYGPDNVLKIKVTVLPPRTDFTE